MANQERLFYGKITLDGDDGAIYRNGTNSFIRIRFDVANAGDTTLTNVTDVSGYYGIDTIRVGTKLVAGTQFPTQVTVTAVDTVARTIEVHAGAAAAGTFRLARISPSTGSYFIESGSLDRPNFHPTRLRNITGSQDDDYNPELTNKFAVVGQLAESSNISSAVGGYYAQYPITNITHRISNTDFSGYISGSVDGVDAEPDGFELFNYVAGTAFAVNELSTSSSYGTIFNATEFELNNSFGFAPYQISLPTHTDTLIVQTGSGEGGGGDAFPFSGSVASITGSVSILSGSLTLSDGILSIPGYPDVSASLAAISGSSNTEAVTSASVALNEIEFNQAGGGTFTIIIDTGSVFSTDGTGIISSSAQINLLGGITTSSILNFDTHVSSAAAEAGFGAGGGGLADLGGTEVISGSEQIGELGAGIISSSDQLTLLGFNSSSAYIHTQSSAATTWNINHDLNYQYANVTVYDGSNQVVLPSTITADDDNNMTVTFPTAQSGYAVIGSGGSDSSDINEGIFIQTGSHYSTNNDVAITGSFGITGFVNVSASLASISASLQALSSQSAFLHVQSVAATTWSVNHNNGNQYPTVTVYDIDDRVVIPEEIIGVDSNNMEVIFPTPQTGYVAVQAGQSAFLSSLGTNNISGSLAIEPLSAANTDDLLQVVGNSASLEISSDGVMTINSDNGLPNAIAGGIVFSGSALYIGVD